MPDMGLYSYWVIIFLMMTGLYVVISKSNLMTGLGDMDQVLDLSIPPWT